MKLYNTLSKNIEDFQPLNRLQVTLYSCGPTVYDYTHIGHLRTYINVDLLKRTLAFLGYSVNHVMNITDVGHLTGDDDAGEDKLEKGAQKSGKTVWETAQFYTEHFLNSISAVNILTPDKLVKATDHIDAMLQLINQLKQKGYTYETKEAIYFNISKFADYERLSGQRLEEKKQQARAEVHLDPDKKNPADFALWFKTIERFKNHVMYWSSPWGEGFPGWHIECSAMSMKYLGETIDIHTGGVDHIPVHHSNEIAQSEAATDKQFVRFWFHSEFLLVDGGKMSKSKGNFYTVDDLAKKGIDPLVLRFLFLQTHYRQQLNFTWESLGSAVAGLKHLKEMVLDLKNKSSGDSKSDKTPSEIENRFIAAISDDLNMPQAFAVLFDTFKSDLAPSEKYKLIIKFDRVLGLGLEKIKDEKIPPEIIDLAQKRQQARLQKDFLEADKLRIQIESMGFSIEDMGTNYKIKPT